MTVAARPPAPPADAALPQLGQLLDADAMIGVLARSADGVERVAIPYVRYRPGKSIDVHYAVVIDGAAYDASASASSREQTAARAAEQQLNERAARAARRSPARSPLAYDPALDALIQWFPIDIDLPALAEPPEALLREVEEAGVALSADAEPELLQYRPRHRAALRLDGHVLKLYGSGRDFAAGVAGFAAAAALTRVRTPRGEATVEPWRLTVQEWLPGAPPASRAAAAREAGALLAELHAAPLRGLPAVDPARRLEKAAAAVRLLAAVAPPLERRARALLRSLELTQPHVDALVPSHGDFHGGQLLELADGYAVIDLDLVCFAPAALDLANYAGHLVAQESLDIAGACAVLDDLAAGYGQRPAATSWFLAAVLLWFTRGPFKRFEEEWPERMERTLAAAEAALPS